MRGAGAIAAALWIGLAGPLAGQGTSDVLTIDRDRLFAETRLGARGLALIEADALALAEENRRIESELAAEERALTDERAGLTPEEFTARADAFDEKVRRIRAEQDAKARALTGRQEQARQEFFVAIGGVLSEIVSERGASVVIERRDVFLSADRVDITDDAIARINARFGEDGAPLGTEDQ